MEWGRHRLELGRRTCIMGIVNVTPDSFSDGGRFLDPRNAVAQGLRLSAEGADIIDIGGESTRPFSEPVSTEQEIRRVVPVIAELAEKIRIPISIDTSKAAVARRALDAGAAMINDIAALRSDEGLAGLAAEFGVPVILMHMRGEPRTMQVAPRYDDLVGEIYSFLCRFWWGHRASHSSGGWSSRPMFRTYRRICRSWKPAPRRRWPPLSSMAPTSCACTTLPTRWPP